MKELERETSGGNVVKLCQPVKIVDSFEITVDYFSNGGWGATVDCDSIKNYDRKKLAKNIRTFSSNFSCIGIDDRCPLMVHVILSEDVYDVKIQTDTFKTMSDRWWLFKILVNVFFMAIKHHEKK